MFRQPTAIHVPQTTVLEGYPESAECDRKQCDHSGHQGVFAMVVGDRGNTTNERDYAERDRQETRPAIAVSERLARMLVARAEVINGIAVVVSHSAS